MTRPRSTEELIHHMPAVRDKAENDWSRGFAASIVRQSRRRHWKPSQKQEAIMRRLVSELFHETNDLEVIEDG
ncbi:hypothetical protein P1J78_04165 [Psychromarinibacter sp. C21-152]|uniref:Uncharacterized protein n=1 Tax=Psychromarinibacter sediminicola TaxID=3033385 RepID=A0AAE3T8V9_9RHOB|nr:hypothetical protein [Psychromarinibacter sediminicola]MDF0599920.1 hypothetical protein [Psychromarinibacter sediminicola]